MKQQIGTAPPATSEGKNILVKPDGYGKRRSICGDTVEMFLSIENDRIITARYRVKGCPITLACSYAMVNLAERKTMQQAWQLTSDHICQYLENLTPDQYHCAELAAGAFYDALTDFTRRQREPWKKNYPRL